MKYSAVIAAPVVLALASQDPGVAALKLTVISPTQPQQEIGFTGDLKATDSSFLQSVLRCVGIRGHGSKDGASENSLSAPETESVATNDESNDVRPSETVRERVFEFETLEDYELKPNVGASTAKTAIEDGLNKLDKHMLFFNAPGKGGVYDVWARDKVLDAIIKNFKWSSGIKSLFEQHENVRKSKMTPYGKTAGTLGDEANETVAKAARNILANINNM